MLNYKYSEIIEPYEGAVDELEGKKRVTRPGAQVADRRSTVRKRTTKSTGIQSLGVQFWEY